MVARPACTGVDSVDRTTMTTPETSLRSLIGMDFGPYRLMRRLGVGGMAEAYEAIRRGRSGFTQRVCLKLVLPFFVEDPDFLQLFEREARLAATLRHSNIVGVIDFGEIDGRSYMALELVDGPDLRILLDQQPGKRLSPELVSLLGLELARALEHAHQPRAASPYEGTEAAAHGIVHRDLSPSNVLISMQGEVMLTDFGVAKAMSGASRKQSAVKGKIPYMSPEQLRAEPLDGRADLFALGVVLYEALAGERPYEGPHDPATIMLILEGDRPRLSTLAPEAPKGLCEMIDSLVDPDPDQRPESAEALIELLDDFAPTPRTRRKLARIAAGTKRATVDAAADISSIQGTEPTESHPEPLNEDTGVKPAGSTPRSSEARAAKTDPPATSDAGMGTEAASVAEPAEQATEPVPLVGGATPLPSRWTRRDRTKVIVGTLLALVGLLGGGVAWWQAGQQSEVDSPPAVEAATEGATRTAEQVSAREAEASKPTRPDAEPRDATPQPQAVETVKAVEANAAPATEPTASPAAAASPTPVEDAPKAKAPKAAPAPVEPAQLTVIVFPWGKVWLNGKLLGSAPIRNRTLRPGRYKVSVGQQAPTQSELVRLRPRQRKSLKFDLTQ